VLEDAIETTEDSIELSQQDLQSRGAEVLAKEKREEAERESALTPDELKERQEAKAKEAAKQPKKAPSLRRPGDPPPRYPDPVKK
jgi:hypothetical protein